jgi:hypothetical protein
MKYTAGSKNGRTDRKIFVTAPGRLLVVDRSREMFETPGESRRDGRDGINVGKVEC